MGSRYFSTDQCFSKDNLTGQALQSAVQNGQVQQSRVDDMVKRILASWYLVGQDKGYPTASFNSWKIGSKDVGGTHRTNVRAMARDGIVLLKNDGAALPLSKPKSIAVIGSDSIVAPKGANACADRGCNDGTLAMGWGSGTAEFPVCVDIAQSNSFQVLKWVNRHGNMLITRIVPHRSLGCY